MKSLLGTTSATLVPVLALSTTVILGCSGGSEPGQAPGAPVDAPPLPAFVSDPCQHVAGGPAATSPAAVGLAQAHAKARVFGPGGDRVAADQALVGALEAAYPIADATLAHYATGSSGVCVVPPSPATLGPASVRLLGDVAVVRPGTGVITLPADAKAAALDLRGLPEAPGLAAALDAAVSAVSSTPVTLPVAETRVCNGLPDEVYGVLAGMKPAEIGYFCPVQKLPGRTIPAGAPTALPLAVLTETRLPPSAALVAVTLRASGAAWLFGEHVATAAAESEWVGVGTSGLTVRTRRLRDASGPLPDVVSADERTLDPTKPLSELTTRGAPTPLPSEEPTRAPITALADVTAAQPVRSDASAGRAAALVAVGTLRAFFPYFDVVPDALDARLDEALATIDASPTPTRSTIRRALRRISQSLEDSHAGVYEMSPTAGPSADFPPAALTPVGDALVVAVSATPDLSPGDTLVSVHGAPIGPLVDGATALISGSPQHVRATLADGWILPSTGAVEVISPDGKLREATLSASATALSTFGMFDRAPGPLTELGAPDVQYLSLDAYGPKPITAAAVAAFVAALPSATGGVILDLRGYPGYESWGALAAVIGPDATGPAMAMARVTSSEPLTLTPFPTQSVSTFTNGSGSYQGKVALLVGAWTQSQAEHMTFFFRDAKRGPTIGEPTSGADGNITGVALPGGFGLLFTGMWIGFPDGGRFHGRGHTPDIASAPTVADLAAGKDTVLLRALTWLQTGK